MGKMDCDDCVHVQRGDDQVIADVRRVGQYKDQELPSDAQDLAGTQAFHLCQLDSCYSTCTRQCACGALSHCMVPSSLLYQLAASQRAGACKHLPGVWTGMPSFLLLMHMASSEPLAIRLQACCCAGRVFTTVYMGTQNSSRETQQRAQRLADQIGADHLDVKIDSVVTAMAHLFATITGFTPRFRVRLSCLRKVTPDAGWDLAPILAGVSAAVCCKSM